jgi:16S rRNA (cytidine1402-2'-O)-methyltransferase
MTKGTLYLIPVVIAEGAEQKSLTPFIEQTINQIKEYIVENEKTARKCLKAAGLTTPQSELIIHDYSKHNRTQSTSIYLKGLEAGNDVGLLSEAGCPGVADPGAEIIAEAHRRNIRVVPLVGPSSLLLALMGSGFNGQSFAFQGYLPIDKMARSKRLKELEGFADRFRQTQLFIETPFRNNPMLNDILSSCKDDTRLCIACDLTSETEFIKTKSIADWKKEQPDLHKRPAIFLIYRTR